jgi:hypothetical protein
MLLPSALDLDVAPALRSLRDEGWARVGNVVAGGALAALRERADDLMLGRVVRPGLFFQIDAATGRYDDLTYGKGWQGPSTDYRKLEKLERDPLFLAFLENALFERIARSWIDGPVALYRAVLFNKSASGGTELPWHQDGGRFWGVDRAPTLQIWTALDDAPGAAGCGGRAPNPDLLALLDHVVLGERLRVSGGLIVGPSWRLAQELAKKSERNGHQTDSSQRLQDDSRSLGSLRTVRAPSTEGPSN